VPNASDYCGGFWAGGYAFDVVDAYASACAYVTEHAAGVSGGAVSAFTVAATDRQTITPGGAPGYGYPAPPVEPVWIASDLVGGRVFVSGVDFYYDAAAETVWFDEDPLLASATRRLIWVDGVPVEAADLFYCAVAAPAAPTHEAGTTAALVAAIAAACDSPAAGDAETVEAVWADATGATRVVTDAAAYRLAAADPPAVAAGSVLRPGDPVGTAWTLTRLGPAAPALAHLTVPAEYHQGVTAGAITWYNGTRATIVDTSGGRTRVRWMLGGTQADVDAFWAASHATGTAAGQTLLAKSMVNPDMTGTDPGVGAVPPSVNPLEFVCRELFAGTAYLLMVYPAKFGPAAQTAAARRAATAAAAGLFAAVFEYEDVMPALTERTPT